MFARSRATVLNSTGPSDGRQTDAGRDETGQRSEARRSLASLPPDPAGRILKGLTDGRAER